MKITEKMWNDLISSKGISKSDCDSSENSLDYYVSICRELFGCEVYYVRSTSYITKESEPSEEGIRMLEDYVLHVLPSKYELVPGLSYISGSMGYKTSERVSEDRSNIFYQSSKLLSGELSIVPGVLFGDDYIVFLKSGSYVMIDYIIYTSLSSPVVYSLIEDFRKFYTESVVKIEYKNMFSVSILSKRLSCSRYLIDIPDDLDFRRDFSSDIPHDSITDFLYSKESGLVLFHGIPGCGKSSYLKYLIKTNPELNFVIVPSGVVLKEGFFDFIIRNGRNRIYIIEDCDKLLKSEDLSDILNLSDGILGDLIRPKFILTFNTRLTRIKESLLREGRTQIIYEFHPFQGEELVKISEELGISPTEDEISTGLTLAELHNYNSRRKVNTVRKIGFQ